MGLLVVAAVGAGLGFSLMRNGQEVHPPDRPAVPAGWTLWLTDTRDTRLAVPPYMTASVADALVMVNVDPGGPTWLQVMVTGPLGTDRIPADLPIDDWLRENVGAQLRDLATFSTVTLPAGMATRMQLLVPNDGTTDEAVYYAIDTGDGLALMTMTGPALAFDRYAADLDLITRLWETGPALTAAIGPRPPRPVLTLELPDGWDHLVVSDANPEVGEVVAVYSNASIPPDLCSRDADGVQRCSDLSAPPQGTFFVTVFDTARGEPRYLPAQAATPPPGFEVASIAGRPASRTIDHAEIPRFTRVFWELDFAADGHSGFLVINMVVSTVDAVTLVPQVDAVLRDATLAVSDS